MRNATVPSQLQMVMIIKYIVAEHLTALSFLDIVINLKTNLFVNFKTKSLEHAVNTWYHSETSMMPGPEEVHTEASFAFMLCYVYTQLLPST